MGLKKLIDLDLLDRFLEKVRALIPSTYASSKTAGGYADKALSVPIATVDSTSTATAFTVQVAEFANETGPRDGMFFYIRNNKVASASGWTLNVNGWGGKPVYNASAERTTTGFALNRMFPCWYDSTLTTDGCWVIGYLTDANTTYSTFRNIDHGNGAGRIAHSVVYRYQMLFEKDSDYVTPLNNVSNGYNKTNKAMLTNVEFDPFGEIFYWYSSGTVAADALVRGDYLNYIYGTLDLRYTFNCGTTLTAYKPFYLVVDIGTNGKAKIASTTPWAQELPSTNDGHYYIFLGRTYSTYQLSLYPCHPVYYHDGTTIRQYLPVDAKSVNGHTVETNVPANAVFTDTTYESKAAASEGTAVSLVTTGEKYTWNNKGTYSKPSGGIPDSDIASAATWNAKGNGTITGITMNGASKGTSGVVDLGTVITAHQDISGKADKSATVSNVAYDSTGKKITKTINGTTSDVVSAATLKSAMSLAKGDVGLGNVDNVKQYSASNPPPYPVTSVNGSTGAVTVSVPSAGTATPKMDGTAAVGTSAKYAKEDHVHPSDTNKADKSATVSNVAYDSTNKKITKTINGTTSDVVTVATLKTAMSLSKSDVGLGNVDNVKQYSASNPPPYPVTSVNGKTGAVTIPTEGIVTVMLDESVNPPRYYVSGSTVHDVIEITSAYNQKTLVTLNYVKSSYDGAPEDGEESFEQYHLSDVYSVTTYDEDEETYIMKFHLIFTSEEVSSSGSKIKKFELVDDAFTYNELIDATVTYSEQSVGAKIFTNVSVPASAWVDTGDEDLPFRATIALTGVTSSHMPIVTFFPDDLNNYIISPVAQSYNGGVYIYADEMVGAAITIPSISCVKGD